MLKKHNFISSQNKSTDKGVYVKDHPQARSVVCGKCADSAGCYVICFTKRSQIKHRKTALTSQYKTFFCESVKVKV